jgi:hypothetical protein
MRSFPTGDVSSPALEPVGSKIFGPGPDKIEILDPDPGPSLPDGLYPTLTFTSPTGDTVSENYGICNTAESRGDYLK